MTGDEPRHRLVPQPGDLTEWWLPYLEPSPADPPPPPAQRAPVDDDTPPKLVRRYVLPREETSSR